MIDIKKLVNDLDAIREKSPLIHNITNFVVMNNTANALLAIGASPVMAHSLSEVEEMVKMASALVINIGTLNSKWVGAMMVAGKAANKNNVPVILDPVGAGATSYRTETGLKIIAECKPAIIRGNASEIMALMEKDVATKGVDSVTASDDAVNSARILALRTNAVVVISGPIDYILDGKRMEEVKNGSPLMTRVTGLGCTATALTGAFAAVNSDYFEACVHAMAVMGIAGEIAAAKSEGPGSLQVHFLDELYNLSEETITTHLKK